MTLVSPNVEVSLHFNSCYSILLVCCQILSADILFRIFVLLLISEIYSLFFFIILFLSGFGFQVLLALEKEVGNTLKTLNS